MIYGECLTSSRGERKPQTRNTFQKIPACDGIRFLKAETSQYAELLAHREFVLGARRRLESCVHSFERPADNQRCKRLLDDLSQFIEVAGQRLPISPDPAGCLPSTIESHGVHPRPRSKSCQCEKCGLQKRLPAPKQLLFGRAAPCSRNVDLDLASVGNELRAFAVGLSDFLGYGCSQNQKHQNLDPNVLTRRYRDGLGGTLSVPWSDTTPKTYFKDSR